MRGRVRVEVLTDRPETRYATGTVLRREGDEAALTIARSQPVADGPGWWLDFREVTDRTAAEALRGAYLEATVGPAELPAGEVYWHEVIGVTVTDLGGRTIGVVEGIYRVGVAEVLVVRAGDRELDIPNVASIVREFAPREGRIVVDAAALDIEGPTAPRKPRGRRTRRAHATGQASADRNADQSADRDVDRPVGAADPPAHAPPQGETPSP